MHVELRSKVVSALFSANPNHIYCTYCLQPAYVVVGTDHLQVYKNQVEMLPWTQSPETILQDMSCNKHTSFANTWTAVRYC